MSTDVPATGLQLFSTVREDGRLELALKPTPVPAPGEDEVVIRVEATPINPSDLGLLLGAADVSQLSVEAGVTSAPIPPAAAARMAPRIGKPMPVGNEGAGTVIAAGAAAQHLLGKVVSLAGGQMYAQYKLARGRDCIVLPPGVTAAEAASSFVNPLTALGMIGTMRREGFEALVHTAAASNLGQMLVKLCQAEGVELVNIVRSAEQADILRGLGAKHVLDSTAPDFAAGLTAAIRETKAFLAFDAIGGGRTADQILKSMEAAAVALAPGFSIYGSSQKKQVYAYGMLDPGPTELTRSYGMAWGIGGWLLTPYLISAGAEEAARMRQYVVDNIRTIFASKYTTHISLHDVLKPEHIARYAKRATGEKFLIVPSLPG
ncbi:MAG: zinc-binding dehydrogenase [Caulobacteraceae bacterium]|nr:zinc-binding dehydrogenase [Caulobacteraceae bacterium]